MLHIAYIPKLETCPDEFLEKYMVPKEIRETLRRYVAYLTDGDRIWWWASFPKTDSLIPRPLGTFIRGQSIYWLTEERPPCANVSLQGVGMGFVPSPSIYDVSSYRPITPPLRSREIRDGVYRLTD